MNMDKVESVHLHLHACIYTPRMCSLLKAGAYAQAPANYERGYVQHRHTYRFRTPRTIERDNTSVPGQGVDKDDTTPRRGNQPQSDRKSRRQLRLFL
jgi:hypothetical protein